MTKFYLNDLNYLEEQEYENFFDFFSFYYYWIFTLFVDLIFEYGGLSIFSCKNFNLFLILRFLGYLLKNHKRLISHDTFILALLITVLHKLVYFQFLWLIFRLNFISLILLYWLCIYEIMWNQNNYYCYSNDDFCFYLNFCNLI